jgi:hypothetical protein
MPATNFLDYAQNIQDTINTVLAAGEGRLIHLQIDPRSSLRGFIAGSLQFSNNSELHFREFVDTSLPELRLMYAYHYQDAAYQLIFRYDNAAHRPALPQVEHKHTPIGVEVSSVPSLGQVLDEILEQMRA